MFEIETCWLVSNTCMLHIKLNSHFITHQYVYLVMSIKFLNTTTTNTMHKQLYNTLAILGSPSSYLTLDVITILILSFLFVDK